MKNRVVIKWRDGSQTVIEGWRLVAVAGIEAAAICAIIYYLFF